MDAAFSQAVDFADEHFEIHDDAGADEVQRGLPQDAAGQQVQGVGLAADLDGMSGIGAAGVADDDVEMLREQIDNLARAFIAPWKTDDGGMSQLRRVHSLFRVVRRLMFRIDGKRHQGIRELRDMQSEFVRRAMAGQSDRPQ